MDFNNIHLCLLYSNRGQYTVSLYGVAYNNNSCSYDGHYLSIQEFYGKLTKLKVTPMIQPLEKG